MRIGIDARLYGAQHTGIGRYTKNLIHNLARLKKKCQFVVFGDEQLKKEVAGYSNFSYVRLTSGIYSWAEQFVNPLIFIRAKLDLLHIPHLNAPLFYKGKMVITVHDLIKHRSRGKETTTLPAYQYFFKHLIYRGLVWINMKRASHIITPSNYWKEEFIQLYNLDPEKITVTYEAVDKILVINKGGIKPTKSKNIIKKYDLHKPFIIYTGNLYPHKNVDFLIKAIRVFNQSHQHQLILAIVCARNIFKKRFSKDSFVKLLNFVPDKDLALLYSQALALVQPSLIEGFGLTGLEAMAAGLPVLSSHATCLPEIYSNAALYFDPYNQADLIHKLEQIVIDSKLTQKLTQRGKIHVKRFSWYKMAKETMKVYEKTISNHSN